jgi:hypothetical protein
MQKSPDFEEWKENHMLPYLDSEFLVVTTMLDS